MLLILLMTVSVLSSGLAYTAEERNEVTGFRTVINDTGMLFESGEIPEILEAAKQIGEYCDTGVLTRYSAQSRDPSVSGVSGHSEDVGYKWGVSVFGETDFIVFVIDMDTREIGIYANQGMLRKFTRADSNTVTDNVSRLATKKQYGTCAVEALNQIANVLAGEKIARPMKYISNVLIAACLSIILCFLIVSRTLKTRNAAEAVMITATAAAGVGTAVLARKLVRTVHHDSSSGGGGHGGGGGGGGHSGGGGHHGF